MTALGHGLIELRMTTDPVELWAAPASQSRLEKDRFDSTFGPFYRIEQVIVKSNEKSFNHSSDGITTEFGPAFNETFLLNVLQLQSDLISIH